MRTISQLLLSEASTSRASAYLTSTFQKPCKYFPKTSRTFPKVFSKFSESSPKPTQTDQKALLLLCITAMDGARTFPEVCKNFLKTFSEVLAERSPTQPDHMPYKLIATANYTPCETIILCPCDYKTATVQKQCSTEAFYPASPLHLKN